MVKIHEQLKEEDFDMSEEEGDNIQHKKAFFNLDVENQKIS